jgi:hypothetical protein
MVSRCFGRVGLCIAHQEDFADWSNSLLASRAHANLLLTVEVRSMLDQYYGIHVYRSTCTSGPGRSRYCVDHISPTACTDFAQMEAKGRPTRSSNSLVR